MVILVSLALPTNRFEGGIQMKRHRGKHTTLKTTNDHGGPWGCASDQVALNITEQGSCPSLWFGRRGIPTPRLQEPRWSVGSVSLLPVMAAHAKQASKEGSGGPRQSLSCALRILPLTLQGWHLLARPVTLKVTIRLRLIERLAVVIRFLVPRRPWSHRLDSTRSS